jgi:hypothetical protein
MKKILKRIWKQLFCQHEYKYEKQVLINGGMKKMITHKCIKCGKEKFYFV